MILAVIQLIPVYLAGGAAVVGGVVGWAIGGVVVGWVKGRSKRKKELKEQTKEQAKENERMKNELKILSVRQKQHEDDLNGIIANQETGQTAEEEEFGIFPQAIVPEQVRKKTEEDDDYEGDDRFELLDL